MRILMVGAGPAAAVLTRFIEAQKGNEVVYYVRAGRKKQLPRIKLIEARTGAIQVREKPACVEPDAPLAAADLVVLAVRAGQLDEALSVAERVPGNPALAVMSLGRQDLAQVRKRIPGRPSVQVMPLFVAWPDADAIRWWHPPLLPSLISGDHDAESVKLAAELAAGLKTAGLPMRAIESPARAIDLWSAGTAALSGRGLRGLIGAAVGAAHLVPKDVIDELRRRTESRARV